MRHRCEHCARWTELRQAFEEGRQDEAAAEAWRTALALKDGTRLGSVPLHVPQRERPTYVPVTLECSCSVGARLLLTMVVLGYSRAWYAQTRGS